MTEPMTADAFLAALRNEGVAVVEVGSWKTHNRAGHGAWGPVNGVMIHHTVTKGTASTVAIVRDGYADLPGPLCHGMIAKDGRVHLVGYGRANHAGLGDPDVLHAVAAETALPADNQATVDGNAHFYGFECENLGDGKDPWPEAQLDAIERVSAAICRHHGWTARSVIGHREWQPGKVDPLGFTMSSMRDRIAARLGHKSPSPAPGHPEVPPFPGTGAFVIGKSNAAVTTLDGGLIRHGFTRHHDGNGYQPGPRFTEYTRQNVADFQRSRPELAGDPDGYPGPLTWHLLLS